MLVKSKKIIGSFITVVFFSVYNHDNTSEVKKKKTRFILNSMNFKNKNSWCEKDVSALYSHDSTVNAALYHVYFLKKRAKYKRKSKVQVD